jgi:WD40 repeat protein
MPFALTPGAHACVHARIRLKPGLQPHSLPTYAHLFCIYVLARLHVALICSAYTFSRVHTWCVYVLACSYDNGDVKMFDLRTMSVRWETHLPNGVCSVQFDRKDIAMNKLLATGLDSKLTVFDLRKSRACLPCTTM